MKPQDGFYLIVKGLMILTLNGELTVDEMKPLIRKIYKKWKKYYG